MKGHFVSEYDLVTRVRTNFDLHSPNEWRPAHWDELKKTHLQHLDVKFDELLSQGFHHSEIRMCGTQYRSDVVPGLMRRYSLITEVWVRADHANPVWFTDNLDELRERTLRERRVVTGAVELEHTFGSFGSSDDLVLAKRYAHPNPGTNARELEAIAPLINPLKR